MAVTSKSVARSRRHLRLRKKVVGTEARPRLVVTRSQRHMFVKVVDDSLGRTLASASTMEADVRGLEGDKTAKARKVGELIAARAKAAGVDAVVFDRGGKDYHGRIAALELEGGRGGETLVGADRDGDAEAQFQLAQMGALLVEDVERHLGPGAQDQVVAARLDQRLLDRPQDQQRHREVDHEPGHIDQRRHERCRSGGRVEAGRACPVVGASCVATCGNGAVDAGEAPFKPSSGTAFSIAGRGRWVTARHVVEGCRKAALVVGEGRAVAADVRLAPRADVALLITDGGPAALPVAVEAPLRKGQRAFHPGFPQGRPGEVTSRLLGRETLKVFGRGARDEPVLSWAEVGRTNGLEGTLSGLSGAPALDAQGRVVGVTIAEAPRRGRIYTTAPETFGPAIRGEQTPADDARGQTITTEDYGQVSNRLRRDLRVAQVVCLSV